jgi:hypothetical protein
MNMTCSLGRGLVPALVIGTLDLIGVGALGAGPEGPTAKRDPSTAAKVVDAIANANKPPKLVTRAAGEPREVPLFPDGYDWKEDRRVEKALDQLFQTATVELWEELVRREHDRAYCITLYHEHGYTSVWTVGFVCGNFAFENLIHPCQQHLPDFPGGHRREFDFAFELRKCLTDWRKKRADKSLYQLQIEVCETALSELPQLELLSEKDKDLARKRIEAEIARLRRSKEPSFGKIDSWAWLGYEFRPEEASMLRKAVKTGYTGNIDYSALK